MLSSVAAALLAVAVAAGSAATPRRLDLPADVSWLASPTDGSYRLPGSVAPLHYRLHFQPDLDGDFRFNGSAGITLNVTEATHNVTFHVGDGLVVTEVSVTVSGPGAASKVLAHTRDKEREFYTVTLDSALTVGEEYVLRINFYGYLGDDMTGFYRSSYWDHKNNKSVWLATTDFEPVSARKAFPCFDEPALKAQFQISIAAPDGLHAISNMPVNYTEIDRVSGRTWYHFQETPMPMSTYLVAFVVSDLENTTSGFVSAWHEPGQQSQGEYASQLGLKLIQAMENFTQVEYFLPKMDQVAIPDFSGGAMENWGIVTFREKMLLFEEGESSTTYKQSIATVIAHEFAHQWFGDLVGPRWWSYTWLNEGFASYFEYLGAALVETTWRLGEQFVVEEVHSAFSSDSSSGSHPMTFPHISTSEQAEMAFDSISYGKAGSVIRMIEHVMSHDTFKKGLNLYLKANGNSTAEDQDLFNSLVEQYKIDFPDSKFDLQDFLDSWVRQTGFPLITVTRNYTDKTVSISQERFLLSGKAKAERWWVPITYATKNEPNFTSTFPAEWLSRNESGKVLEKLVVGEDDWVILNVQQTGFYRVNYDADNWRLLVQQLNSDKFEVIPAVNRAQILNDAFTLARAGRLDNDVVLQLFRYLWRETDYIPWDAALKCISLINSGVKASSQYSVFKDFVLELIKPSYKALGFEEKAADDHATKLYRSLILQWACDLGHSACKETAVSKFKAFLADPDKNKVAPDLRPVVYCHGLQATGYDAYATLWQRYLKTNVATERAVLLKVLACTGNETAAHEYLLNTINKETAIKAQDIAWVTSSIFSVKTGVDFYISFIAKYYKEIINYNNRTSEIISMVVMVSDYLETQEQYKKLEQFLTEHQKELGITDSVDSYMGFARMHFSDAEAEGDKVARVIKQTYRLPSSLRPVSYHLNLRPHLSAQENFTFDGTVVARVLAQHDTDRVVLHANNLEMRAAAEVTPAEGRKTIAVLAEERDELRQFHTIVLGEQLKAGQEYDVKLSYVGHLLDDMSGFYRSYYNVDGGRRWLGVTQFESTGARKAFPCFDEPALKANITLSIERPANYTSVSNMELYNTTDVSGEDGLKRDTFWQTPPISTYLLAFLVSDFAKESDSGGGVNVSLWLRPSATPQAAYALNISRSLLRFMEEFTGIPFPLPKMDQVAVPDFSAGAMENWGLVTYRDRMILFDEAVTMTADKQTIATVIAHEFSHQWFGDLVSPAWWSYAWLNEGFASYFEMFAAAAVEKGWRLDEQFVVRRFQAALASDAHLATHAITSDVYTPDEIEAVFDYVSYGKAGGVLRMASHFLTKEVFRKGLSLYLNERKYSTGRPDYLFSALQRAASDAGKDVNVSAVMSSWTLQKGYPVVTVLRDYDNNTADVFQNRFLVTKDSSSSGSDQTNWWVPLTYTTKSKKNFANTNETIWLDGRTKKINDLAKSEDWVIFNLQETGFYRVNYDEVNWKLLAAQLNSDGYQDIHVLNRAQLLDDSLNLARAGDLDYRLALNLVSYLKRETDYVPWYSAFTSFTFLDVRLSGMSDEQYALFKDFVVSLLSHLFDKHGLEPNAEDDHVTKLLRSDVASWACKLEMPDCVYAAIHLFHQKMENSSSIVIPADVSQTVYCTTLRHGGESEWKFLKSIYDNSNVASEQVMILSALGCSVNESIINNYLRLSITPFSGIRKQDAASTFSAVYSNPAGVDIALNFLTENYETLSTFYNGMGSTNIGTVISGLADRLSTQTQLDKLRKFVDDNKANLGTALEPFTQAVETAEGNMRWLHQRQKVIADWLLAWNSSQPVNGSGSAVAGASTSSASASLLVLTAASVARLLL